LALGIQICSGTEWRAARHLLDVPADTIATFPYGEYVRSTLSSEPCVFYHSRRTKTRAAGACQYAIDHWAVDRLLVIGTCGGVAADVDVLDLVVASRTMQYDCDDDRPDMGRTVTADCKWLNLDALGQRVRVGPIASADRDLTYDSLASLRREGVVAADWESGAIALVCTLNGIRWAVIRGVSDVPRAPGSEDRRRQLRDYRANTPAIMARLLAALARVVPPPR
jgi:nucleoside phosphorylase